jgi:hypothetical protein
LGGIYFWLFMHSHWIVGALLIALIIAAQTLTLTKPTETPSPSPPPAATAPSANPR